MPSVALLCALALSACGSTQMPNQENQDIHPGEVSIILSDERVTVDGMAASQTVGDAVYLSNDIIYYEDRDAYDSGNPTAKGPPRNVTAPGRHPNTRW